MFNLSVENINLHTFRYMYLGIFFFLFGFPYLKLLTLSSQSRQFLQGREKHSFMLISQCSPSNLAKRDGKNADEQSSFQSVDNRSVINNLKNLLIMELKKKKKRKERENISSLVSNTTLLHIMYK